MNPEKILENCRGKKVLMIGDILCDRYIFSRTDRVSREAPVLVLEHEGEQLVAGGAANVALNLQDLGAQVFPAGWVGQDGGGHRIKEVLKSRGLEVEYIPSVPNIPTVMKTRILAGGQSQRVKQQVLRLDQGKSLSAETAREILPWDRILQGLQGIDGVIFSDYGYGTVKPWLIEKVLKSRLGDEALLAGDSRFNLDMYKDFDILTPNEVEARDFAGTGVLEDMGNIIQECLHPQALLITRGGQGMALFLDSDLHHIPAAGFTTIADVSGAGDTVLAAVVMARLSGATWQEAARFASLAAAVVVRKAGTATATGEEILALYAREVENNAGS